ncbi:MAG: hypothetical protein GX607_02645 [Myxococcales bacterium]|nr:hypothetical protein [Myxococcales bacterium]
MLPIDVSALPPAAQKALAPESPAPLKLLAAKGVIPGVGPGDALAVVVRLTEAEDEKVSTAARATLDALPKPLLEGALRADLQAPVVHALAERLGHDDEVLVKLLAMPRLAVETLEALASRATEKMGELIATNEALLLRYPSAIEKLYMNKAVRMSTADRLIHLAVRNGIELGFAAFKEAAVAIQNELIVEPTEEPTFDDELFRETAELSTELAADLTKEDVCEPGEDGQEVVKPKFVPIFAKIAQMTVTQKIRTAILGSGTERMLLIRDSNRLVAEAAAKSPRMTEAEAVLVASSRAVSEDVLRVIAMNRDFTKNYQVKFNLVSNPRTPFTFASRLVPHLRDGDLRTLARSKNVPGAISTAARQQLLRKQK